MGKKKGTTCIGPLDKPLCATSLHLPLPHPIATALVFRIAQFLYSYLVFPNPPDFVSLANVTNTPFLPLPTC